MKKGLKLKKHTNALPLSVKINRTGHQRVKEDMIHHESLGEEEPEKIGWNFVFNGGGGGGGGHSSTWLQKTPKGGKLF